MGLPRAGAKLLMKESARRPFGGSVLTLGRQDVFFSYDSLKEFARDLGFQLRDLTQVTLHREPGLAAQGYMSDDSFFDALGFAEKKVLDYSNYEAPDFIFDLNRDELPEDLTERFDVIVDLGTTEHVFHIPNALKNLTNMLRPHGRIIHLLPTSNYIDHGFYCFSPTFFCDYYLINAFEINTVQLVRHTPRHDTERWDIMDYVPGCLYRVSFGGLDDHLYQTLAIVTKTQASTTDRIPQQTFFREIWDRTHPSVTRRPVEKSRFKEAIKAIPVVSAIARGGLHFLRRLRQPRKGPGLKVLARY